MTRAEAEALYMRAPADAAEWIRDTVQAYVAIDVLRLVGDP